VKSIRKDKRLITASVITCVIISATCLFAFSTSSDRMNESSNNNTQKDEATMSYSTSGEQEEVPHFNLFSIINKFIPH
jgi:hypothetical protein